MPLHLGHPQGCDLHPAGLYGNPGPDDWLCPCYPHSPSNHQQAHCAETLPQGYVHLLAASIYLFMQISTVHHPPGEAGTNLGAPHNACVVPL